MAYETIRYEKKDAIGVLTLNRPASLNALDPVMVRELRHIYTERLEDFDTRVLILTGAGKGFCSGLDLNASAVMPEGGFPPKTAYEKQREFSELILLMRRIPQPIIGAINGAAAGAGLSFTLACDVRYAVPKAKFAAAYINIGVGGADMGSSWLFPRAVGAANASRYLLTGDLFFADEALRIGLVQAIYEPEQLMAQAMALAQTMASKSPLGLRLTKEAINQNIGGCSLEEAIRLEDRNQAMCITQMSAFAGK